MAVYVDDPIHKLGRMKMAHMTADTLEELHAAAEVLGLKRDWYQGPPRTRFAHYDVSKGRVERALQTASTEALQAAHHALTSPPCGLTTRQRDGLQAILNLEASTHVGPSYQEIGDALGITRSNAWKLVGQLEARGWVRRTPGRDRSIAVLHRPDGRE